MLNRFKKLITPMLLSSEFEGAKDGLGVFYFMKEAITGVYKITSPTGKIYIGQSRNIRRRFIHYRNITNCKLQHKLFRSLKKYGSDSHSFEVIVECNMIYLNVIERYYQEYYNVISPMGLNLMLTNTTEKPKILSEETRIKMSESGRKCIKNYKHSKESIEKMRRSKKLNYKTMPQEQRDEISKFHKGRKKPKINKHIFTDEEKQIISLRFKGKKLSADHCFKISESKQRGKHHMAKMVLNLDTGIYYMCVKDFAESLGMAQTSTAKGIRGIGKRKLNAIYV